MTPAPPQHDWLGRLIRLGRDRAMPSSQARYVVLTNIVSLLGFCFTLGFAPVLFLTGSLLYPALQLVYALAYLPPLWLNHRKHPSAATTWLLLASQLACFSQVLVAGRGFDVHFFLYLHAAFPFMLCAPQQNTRMIVLSALAGSELLLLSALGHRLPQLGPHIDPTRVHILRSALLPGLFATLASCAYYARRATLIAEEALDRAHARSEELLLNMLPSSIADRLKLNGGTIADGFAEVTVLFADIVGFTTMSSRLQPNFVVEPLNELFCSFDDLAGRIGLHSDPVVAGVIGKRKFIYDLWGDTVNIASRMESHGRPGFVQVSDASQRLLDAKYECTDRRTIDVKGKGRMDAWMLQGPRVEAPTS